MPSLREDLDKEIAAYRQQVGNGLSLHERIIQLDRLVSNYKPLGLNVVDLETERSRLILEEKQQQLRVAESQDKATELYTRGVTEYKAGQYQSSLETFREAERLLPADNSIRELRRKLESITSVVESDMKSDLDSILLRLALQRYLENDPRRAINALTYAEDRKVSRPDMVRIQRLIEKDHPEIESPRPTSGVSLIGNKLQLGLEAIYDGRYLTAISECSDVLDLEPDNVMALTRLGSAYFAMNEKDKAKQIWTKALQLDPSNDVLKKFLYGQKGASRVEVAR